MIHRRVSLYLFVAAICFFTFPELAPLSNAQERPSPQSTIDSSKEPAQRSLADLKRDLETAENLKGSEHPDLIPILQSIAKARREVGAYVPALESVRRAQAIADKTPGEDELTIAGNLDLMGTLELSAGDSVSALKHYEQAWTILQKKVAADNPANVMMQTRTGAALLELGKLTEAESALEKSLGRATELYGLASEEVIPIELLLGEVYLREGKYSRAEQQFTSALAARSESVSIQAAAGKITHADAEIMLAPIRTLLGALYTVAGARDEAGPLLVDALKAYEVKLGPNDEALEKVLVNLGALAQTRGNARAAAEYQKRAAQIHTATTGFAHLPGVPLPEAVRAPAIAPQAPYADARVGDWVAYQGLEGTLPEKKEVTRKTSTALWLQTSEWDRKTKRWQPGDEGLVGLTEDLQLPGHEAKGPATEEKVNIQGRPVEAACRKADSPLAKECRVCEAPGIVPLGGFVKLECDGRVLYQAVAFGNGK